MSALEFEVHYFQSDSMKETAGEPEVAFIIIASATAPPPVHHVFVILHSHLVRAEAPVVLPFAALAVATLAVAPALGVVAI